MSITVASSPAPSSLGTGSVTGQKVDQGAMIASMRGTISEPQAVARNIMGNVPRTPPANMLGSVNLYA
ncbi:MAG: hypothetical protein RL635_496 [Chloroflexota bacterium]|jgi:hypothetical protein